MLTLERIRKYEPNGRDFFKLICLDEGALKNLLIRKLSNYDGFDENQLEIEIKERSLENSYWNLGSYPCAYVYYEGKYFEELLADPKINPLELDKITIPINANDYDFPRAFKRVYPDVDYDGDYDDDYEGKYDMESVGEEWIEVKKERIEDKEILIFDPIEA